MSLHRNKRMREQLEDLQRHNLPRHEEVVELWIYHGATLPYTPWYQRCGTIVRYTTPTNKTFFFRQGTHWLFNDVTQLSFPSAEEALTYARTLAKLEDVVLMTTSEKEAHEKQKAVELINQWKQIYPLLSTYRK
jgi:hypothetical protein